MTSLLCYLIPLVLLAVALDLYIVRGLQKFKKLKKEFAGDDGLLKTSTWDLLRQAYGRKNKAGTAINDMNHTFFQKIPRNLQGNPASAPENNNPKIREEPKKPNGKTS